VVGCFQAEMNNSWRFADILAHRQLAAAIGYSSLHATLHSKTHVERVLDVVNRRHRMAQMAGRASVEFYVGLALKARGQTLKHRVQEDAFIIRTFRNGLGVFVSKYVFVFATLLEVCLTTHDLWLSEGWG
jgi:exosome complex exonuclease DIS3/RRP44